MRRATMTRAPAALAALTLAACLDVAEERAQRDSEVGRAAAAGVSVAVEEGLAAIQAIDPDGITLWAGAPRIALSLTLAPRATPLSVALRNVLPEAELAISGAAFTPGAVVLPTQRRIVLEPLPGGGVVSLTLAPPDLDGTGRFRFAVFADVQEDVGRVQDIFARMNRDPRLRFVVASGDLTRYGSAGELMRIQREIERLRVPTYATLGNHELGTRPDLFHDYFGRGNFRFLFHGVQITLLDSASATLAPTAYRWLDGWLAEGRDRVHVVTMHIPPLDPIGTRNGAFASRAEAGKLLARLADGRVDLTVYGHLHSYYAYSNAGIPAVITGGGGAVPERFDGVGRHYLAIDVDPVTGIIETTLVRVD